MGDQRRWFKVWTSALTDPHLGDLPEEPIGRWVRLGLYLTEHGKNGCITLKPPSKALVNVLKTDTFEGAIVAISAYPNSTVTPVTIDGVTCYRVAWRNWEKYQGDYSLDRVRKHREKKRRERVSQNVSPETASSRERESRESREIHTMRAHVSSNGADGSGFDQFYAIYPRHAAPATARKAWKAAIKREKPTAILAALGRQMESLTNRPKDKIPYPATWLNGEHWRNDVDVRRGDDNPYANWPTLHDCGACERGCHETLDARDECRAEHGLPAMPRA